MSVPGRHLEPVSESSIAFNLINADSDADYEIETLTTTSQKRGSCPPVSWTNPSSSSESDERAGGQAGARPAVYSCTSALDSERCHAWDRTERRISPTPLHPDFFLLDPSYGPDWSEEVLQDVSFSQVYTKSHHQHDLSEMEQTGRDFLDSGMPALPGNVLQVHPFDSYQYDTAGHHSWPLFGHHFVVTPKPVQIEQVTHDAVSEEPLTDVSGFSGTAHTPQTQNRCVTQPAPVQLLGSAEQESMRAGYDLAMEGFSAPDSLGEISDRRRPEPGPPSPEFHPGHTLIELIHPPPNPRLPRIHNGRRYRATLTAKMEELRELLNRLVYRNKIDGFRPLQRLIVAGSHQDGTDPDKIATVTCEDPVDSSGRPRVDGNVSSHEEDLGTSDAEQSLTFPEEPEPDVIGSSQSQDAVVESSSRDRASSRKRPRSPSRFSRPELCAAAIDHINRTDVQVQCMSELIRKLQDEITRLQEGGGQPDGKKPRKTAKVSLTSMGPPSSLPSGHGRTRHRKRGDSQGQDQTQKQDQDQDRDQHPTARLPVLALQPLKKRSASSPLPFQNQKYHHHRLAQDHELEPQRQPQRPGIPSPLATPNLTKPQTREHEPEKREQDVVSPSPRHPEKQQNQFSPASAQQQKKRYYRQQQNVYVPSYTHVPFQPQRQDQLCQHESQPRQHPPTQNPSQRKPKGVSKHRRICQPA